LELSPLLVSEDPQNQPIVEAVGGLGEVAVAVAVTWLSSSTGGGEVEVEVGVGVEVQAKVCCRLSYACSRSKVGSYRMDE
jgi:hypothetical protein